MTKLPETENTLFLRVDYSDNEAWNQICAEATASVGNFRASIQPLSDAQYDGANTEKILNLIGASSNHTFVFIVDKTTISEPEHPILCVDLFDDPGCTFRVIPSQTWSVENNLSLANMDFSEFADAVDSDGVFRGFSE